ncbi:unnamed protein product [Schistosoma guineensis]|nr:unnamed protein product [Schistosoma guineensis]
MKKCQLPSCDEETDNPVVVTESRTTVATEQWANIVTDTATVSFSYIQCSDNPISCVMSEMSPAIHHSIREQLDSIVIEMMKGDYISIKKADQILDLLRARYPELPTSVRSVLRRCNDVEPKTLESGTYYHLGLKSTLLRTSENWLRNQFSISHALAFIHSIKVGSTFWWTTGSRCKWSAFSANGW